MTKSSSVAASDVRFRPEDPDADEIDLRKYVIVLWNARLLILGAAFVLGVAGLSIAFFSDPVYEAELAMAVSRSKLGGDTQASSLTTADFRPFVENGNVASQVIKELGLAAAPYRFAAESFFDGIVTISEVRASTVMVLRARLNDPKIVARILNRVAELASEATRRVSHEEALRGRDALKVQMDESRARLEQAEARIRSLRQTSQIELLRKDIDSALNQRGGLLTLLVTIETERARLAKAEEELTQRQRIDTVKRSIDSEPALLESARPGAGPSKDFLALELRNEFVNPVYQGLDQQIATSRTTLAALERQKSQIVDIHKLDGAQLDQLTRLYQVESDLAHSEMELELARRVYLQVATNYETARLLVAGRSAELQVISPAIEPDRPRARPFERNLGIGIATGLVLATLFVLLQGAMLPEKREPSLPRPV